MTAGVQFPAGVGPFLTTGGVQERKGEPRPGAASVGAPTSSSIADASTLSLGAAREAALSAIGSLDLAQRAGRAGLQTLDKGSPPEETLAQFRALIDQAIANGAGLLKGEPLALPADATGGLIEIGGEDVRATSSGDLPALRDRLAAALDRFAEARAGLDVHAGLLGRLESAVAGAVRGDLDSDGARLAALQVSQALAGQAGGIASESSRGILSLFKDA